MLKILTASIIVALGLNSSLATESPLKSGIDPANFDTSVKPQDQFYQYVNGGWIARNPMPAEYSRWGAFPQLRDTNLIRLHEIMDELGRTEQAGERKKLRDFYLTATDEASLAQQSAATLKPELDLIAGITTSDQLIRALGKLRAAGSDFLFGFGAYQDEKDSARYAAHLTQDGLGLPEREYYLGTTDDSKRIRAEYLKHVAKMLSLLGDADDAAAKDANTVLAIETELATASRTPTQLRDQEANYNLKTRAQLIALTPNIDWDTYCKAVEVSFDKVIVGQPEFFTRVNDMIKTVPAEQWRVYLRWHLIHEFAAYLNSDFENENFRFYASVLKGIKVMQPRWKRVLTTLDREMGEALGKLYAERYFTPAARARMDTLVKNVLESYGQRIDTRDWMSAATKEQAHIKLAAIATKIGYPSKWRDYTDLEVGTDSYARNIIRASTFHSRYYLARLDKPVDRTEWHMHPQTVNAYYSSTMNEIVFPAGILQPPFFDPQADDAVNYGGIGSVIGHEMTHGFDDQGSRSDANGNLRNWWTLKDRARFIARTDKLAKQFDACVAVDDLHVNGKLTLGENIADLGGIAISFAAYTKSLDGHLAPVIDGFTGPQRFFIGYAQVWRGSIRDADQRLLLRTDPHSPARFRTMIPLSNINAFYEAFDVKPGDTMYRPPEERVEVW